MRRILVFVMVGCGLLNAAPSRAVTGDHQQHEILFPTSGSPVLARQELLVREAAGEGEDSQSGAYGWVFHLKRYSAATCVAPAWTGCVDFTLKNATGGDAFFDVSFYSSVGDLTAVAGDAGALDANAALSDVFGQFITSDCEDFKTPCVAHVPPNARWALVTMFAGGSSGGSLSIPFDETFLYTT